MQIRTRNQRLQMAEYTARRKIMLLLFVRVLRRFQQFFSHITTVSGCDTELNAHFYSVASLKYHAPDT